ncbi:MAG: hypothetical protein R3E12_10430 [Candidatus Eisenbacteria bacterium]|uniref:Lipoprotein n=1 Tax=Eiseniibacteriota bacterium TaxID=2212470 RepID=A0A956M253_UNCEI|nr:hypothetical protein [Candidatus Eisenbacteria bacterium]
MNTKRISIATFLGAVLALSGCSSDNVRSTLWVSNINETAALASDVYNNGRDGTPGTADDFVIEDNVPVSIVADENPGTFVVRGGAYSVVTIESYTVAFDSDEEIDGFTATLGWNVEVGTVFNGSLTIVPAGLKTRAPLTALQNGGEFRTNAHITFHGKESNSGNKVTFETSLPVNFANWVDPN